MTEDLEKSLGTIATGGSILFIGMVMGIIFGIVNQILLGRFLGVNNYGLFYLGLTIVTILVPFSTLDLPSSLSRFLPFHYSRGEKDIVKSAIHFSELLTLFLSVFFCIILFFFSEKISVEVFHNIDLTPVLKYFAFFLPFFSLSSILEGVLRSFKAAKYKVAIIDVGQWIIRIAFFILFIIMGYFLFGAILSYLIGSVFAVFTSLYIIRKKLFPDQSKYQKVPVAKKLIAFSWPITISAIIFLLISKTDVILIGVFLDSSKIGIYTPSLIIAQYLIMIAAPFMYLFLPVMSELFGRNKFDTIESLFKSTSKWIILIVLPIYIYVMLFPQEIITILYGADFSSGYLSLVILATGLCMNVFTGVTGNILIAGGYTKLYLLGEIIAAITNISLNLVLIPIYGIIGAAISVSVSYFVRNFISLIFVYKTIKMHAYNKSYSGIVFSGLVIFFVGFILKTQIFVLLTPITTALIIGVIIFILYLALIWISKSLDKNDRFILKLIIRKIRANLKT